MFIPICCLGSSSGVGSGSDGWSDGEGVGVVGSGRLWFGVGGGCVALRGKLFVLWLTWCGQSGQVLVVSSGGGRVLALYYWLDVVMVHGCVGWDWERRHYQGLSGCSGTAWGLGVGDC